MKNRAPAITLGSACPLLGYLKRHFEFRRALQQLDHQAAIARHKRAYGELHAPQFGMRA